MDTDSATSDPYRTPPAKDFFARYPFRPKSAELWLFVIVPGPSLLCLAFMFRIADAVAHTTRLGFAAPIVIFLGLPVLAGLLFRQKMLNSKNGIALSERGFEIIDNQGLRFFEWSAITELRVKRERVTSRGVPSPQIRHHHVVKLGETEIAISNGYQEAEALVAEFARRTEDVLLRHVSKRLGRGKKVSWFPLVLLPHGLKSGREQTPWASARATIEWVESGRDQRYGHVLEAELLVIWDERGVIAKMLASDVPNAHLMPKLCDMMRSGLDEPSASPREPHSS
jgi:hypothetical protein